MFAERRDVGYIDTYIVNLVQPLSASACSGAVFAMPAHDETAYVVLPLTGREISRLISCVEYGADLLYPAASHEIYWTFVQGLECSVLCDAIASECLQSEEFLQTLSQALLSAGILQDGTSVTNNIAAASASAVLVDLGAGCSANDRYGACYEIVRQLDVVANDVLDVLALYSTNVELAQQLAKKVPIIGEYLSTAAMVAKYMIDVAIDGYLVAFNTTSHDVLACAIYCQMFDSCQLTLQHVLDGYRDVLTVELTLPSSATDWLGVAEFLRDIGSIAADEVLAGSLHWLILQVFARGSAVNAATLRILTIALSEAPSLSPPETCDCSGWRHTFDFTIDNGGWSVADLTSATGGQYSVGAGVYVTSTGWQTTQEADGSYYCRIAYDFGIDVDIDYFGYTLISNKSYTETTYRDAADAELETDIYEQHGSGTYVSHPAVADVRSLEFQHSNVAGYGAGALVTQITVGGPGADPFAA